MVIDDHTSDARTIENENNEQSLQGYNPPVGFFSWSHARDEWRSRVLCFQYGISDIAEAVCAVVIAEKGESRYNI